MATPTACRHYCPHGRHAHAHATPCAYPGMPQVCPGCYPRYIAKLERQEARRAARA